MHTIRYGIIGVRGMGSGHYHCLEAIPDAEVIAVADNRPESLNLFQHRLHDWDAVADSLKGVGHEARAARQEEWETIPAPPYNGPITFFSDYRKMLELDDLDAVVIATPDCTHVDIVLDCLAAGKHVLSEKPAATTVKQLSTLEVAVAKSDRTYQVGLECRYLPTYQTMRRMIVEENAIGRPVMTWCLEFRGPFLRKVDNWIMSQEKTGGVFVEKTCHFFDLMAWLVDSVPKTVTAVAGQDVVKEIYGIKPDIFDNGWVTIEYENGARGMLGLCMFGAGRKPLSITVLGEDGQMEGLFGPQKIEVAKRGVSKMEVIEAGADNEYAHLSHGGGVYFEHLAFIDSIRTGRTPLTDIETARWSTLVGLAAEESARNGSTPVNL